MFGTEYSNIRCLGRNIIKEVPETGLLRGVDVGVGGETGELE